MLIGYENRADDAVVYASSAIYTLPAALLKNQHVGRKWRANGDTSVYLTIDLGAPAPVRATWLGGTNIARTATMRHRLSLVDPTAQAGDVYDSGAVAAAVDQDIGQWIGLLPDVRTARYVRIDIGNDVPPEAGRLWVGDLWQPHINPAYGMREGLVDLTERTRTRGGQQFVDRRRAYRVAEWGFDALDDVEVRSDVRRIDRMCGLHTDVLAIFDPDDPQTETIFGLLGSLDLTVLAGFDLNTRSYKIEERL